MLHHDSHGRLLLAREHAARLAQDYGRLSGPGMRRLSLDPLRLLSRRRRRRLHRARASSA